MAERDGGRGRRPQLEGAPDGVGVGGRRPALPEQSGVPVVLDGAIGAGVEHPRDGGSLVAVLRVRGDDDGVLLRREGATLHAGAKVWGGESGGGWTMTWEGWSHCRQQHG